MCYASYSMAANHYQKDQINYHSSEHSVDIFWVQGRKCGSGQAKRKKRRTNSYLQLVPQLIVTCSWCLNICCNVSNLCIFKMFRIAISVGWSREKIALLQHLLAASRRAICLGEQIYSHREFFPANLRMLPLVLQKKNWGTIYHVMQMAAEGICHNSFFDMNYVDCWCRFQSDNKSGNNNWIELNFVRNTQLDYV